MTLESLVFNSIREPIVVVSGAGDVLLANRAFADFVGVSGSPEVYPHLREFWPDGLPTHAHRGEISTEFRSNSGEILGVRVSLSPLSESRTMIRITSGNAQRDGRLGLHTQRLETLGMLAGGVAHDFNNILAGMLGHVSYLKTILPESGGHRESLDAIEEGGKRAAVMTQQILSFSRNDGNQKPKTISINDFVQRTCLLLRGAISPKYLLEQELSSQPLHVLAGEGNLAQVLINLVINARDSLAENGRIVVGVNREVQLERLKKLLNSEDPSAASYVRISVKDNGSGMSPEVIQRIFEPYFSTKKERGTGLGLATVDAIIKALGGAVDVESELGKGTCVSIYIPELQGESDNIGKSANAGPRLPHGDERILVVDDEATVRNVLSVSLQHLGYKVDSAASGIEALERFAHAAAGYDLVILDMLMPNLSGDQVFFRLQEISPAVRVLLISGYSSEGVVRKVLAHGGLDFIQKPFTIEDLAKKVRECIER